MTALIAKREATLESRLDAEIAAGAAAAAQPGEELLLYLYSEAECDAAMLEV